ncbi:MAG: hypothetical protein IOC82_11675 [Aestuariivirga sp.]|uniref:hypothetical protein n=1 Tax=Aestuariivirga sp. TaxID=2650926 RepID=UPI0025B9A9D9|nr:hypothetical protein [Aestuariivirga sp.]MCA3561675.1 hypothetical protein [Aestuariivirga sp.]
MTGKPPDQQPATNANRARELAFLHIGKNAGTQIMHLAQQLTVHGLFIRQLSHATKLYVVPEQIAYFFSIRNPITRFKSGFYSRKRKGQPRIYVEWSRAETMAFGAFEHANDLAEALFRTDARGLIAAQAISAIRHTSMQQIDWFERIGFLDARPPVWIVRQENFAADFDALLARFGMKVALRDLRPAKDSASAHSNDYSNTPDLSDLAKENLQRWYARDMVFYDVCVKWLEKHR